MRLQSRRLNAPRFVLSRGSRLTAVRYIQAGQCATSKPHGAYVTTDRSFIIGFGHSK